MTGTNATRDPDSVLAAWLDEGPTDLPDATRRAIVTALPTTPQARRGPRAPWRFIDMNTFARAAAVLAAAVIGLGAVMLLVAPRGGVGEPSPASTASPTPGTGLTLPPLPALDATFVSPTHGYEVRYPTGWIVTPGTGAWPPGTVREPGNPVSDAIISSSADNRVRLSGASIALPAGTTMDQFRAFASPYSSPFDPSPCTPVHPLPGQVTFNAESSSGAGVQPIQAVVSINGCLALAELGGYIYDIEVIAGGRGYTFTLDGHISTADALAWLAAVTLKPADASTPSASSTPAATASAFVSSIYGYTATIPAAWNVIPATQAWDTTSAVGHDDPIVDQLDPPEQSGRCQQAFLCAPINWAYARPWSDDLAAWQQFIDAADARDHPCPPAPETTSQITIDGAPAVLEVKHCEPVTGILVMDALTVRNGTAYAFYSQDQSREQAVEGLDRSDFEALLATVRLP